MKGYSLFFNGLAQYNKRSSLLSIPRIVFLLFFACAPLRATRSRLHTTAAIVGKLVRYEETGDHNLYILEAVKVFADEAETPLFAWKGYAEAAPAQKA